MFKQMVMFAASLASRGISSKKINEPTKQLRVLSCYGYGDIAPCPNLLLSKNRKNHYCGKCGCGDHRHTWLIRDSESYSKLDYPKLNCPLKMPGFTNYDPNFYDKDSKERKEKIEEFDPNNLHLIQVTIGSNPLQEKINEQLDKMIEDS